jgi:hypothetical protein
MESTPVSPNDGILCPACGHRNPAGRTECEKCHAKLVPPNMQVDERVLDRRPGCVSAYAVLMMIGAFLIAIGSILGGLGLVGKSSGSGVAGLLILVIGPVIAVLYFLVGRGLWLLQNWARIIVMVLQSLGILSNLVSARAVFILGFSGSYSSQADLVAGIIRAVVGLAVGGYILYWFGSHGEYFRK